MKAVDQPTLEVRTATASDASLLSAWNQKPHVRWATSDSGTVAFDMVWEDELAPRRDGTEFFIAEVDGKPIGALQIIDPATERSHYWGAVAPGLRAIDIWIGEEDYLGRGFGTGMMRFAIEYCFSAADVVAILIDPLAKNTRAHAFYRRFGFEFVERRRFDAESDCYVFRLEREDWMP